MNEKTDVQTFVQFAHRFLQGFTAHVISTIGEWVTAFTFLSFFFTYVREFQKFQLTIVTRPMVRHLDEEPCVDQEPNEHTRLLI
jgi:hypothetical protein